MTFTNVTYIVHYCIWHGALFSSLYMLLKNVNIANGRHLFLQELGSTKQGSFHLQFKLELFKESLMGLSPHISHWTHSDWHWLYHFYWIAFFLMQTWLNTSLWKVLLSLLIVLKDKIGIFGWLFMAKCLSNNFNVSEGLVHSIQTEPWKWSIVPAKVIHYIFTISILSRAELLCYGDLLPPCIRELFMQTL